MGDFISAAQGNTALKFLTLKNFVVVFVVAVLLSIVAGGMKLSAIRAPGMGHLTNIHFRWGYVPYKMKSGSEIDLAQDPETWEAHSEALNQISGHQSTQELWISFNLSRLEESSSPALFFQQIYSSFEIFVDGKKLTSYGNFPSANSPIPSEPTQGPRRFRLFQLPKDSQNVLLHVYSSVQHIGVQGQTLYGNYPDLISTLFRYMFPSFVTVILCLGLGLYQLTLYVRRPEIIEHFTVGACCFFTSVFPILQENSLGLLFPQEWFDLDFLFILVSAGVALFCLFFAQIWKNKKLTNRIFSGFALYFALIAGLLIGFLTSAQWNMVMFLSRIWNIGIVVMLLVLVPTCFWRAFKGDRESRILVFGIFILASTSLPQAIALIFGNKSGINAGWSSNVAGWGVFAMTLTFSQILARRWALQQQQIANELVLQRHVAGELGKVVYPHVVSRIFNKEKVEQSMPAGRGQCTCLSFDIIGSSKVESPNFQAAVDRFMGKCWDVLHQNYDPDELRACAFRVKTAGDGFIASVGFPFGLPKYSAKTAHVLAVELAEQIIIIWQEEMRAANLDVHGSVGVACGEVQGYFPVAGPKQYDLWGAAVILACRYEALRKAMEKRFPIDGSIVIVQEAVFRALDPQHQQTFSTWDCQKYGLVRDDGYAKFAFYKMRKPGR